MKSAGSHWRILALAALAVVGISVSGCGSVVSDIKSAAQLHAKNTMAHMEEEGAPHGSEMTGITNSESQTSTTLPTNSTASNSVVAVEVSNHGCVASMGSHHTQVVEAQAQIAESVGSGGRLHQELPSMGSSGSGVTASHAVEMIER